MAVSHLVRSAALEGFSDLLVELSADPEPLLLQARINPRFLEDPDHFISYRAVIRLLELAARETNCPHFGLLLSRKQGVSMLGAVGLYVQQALMSEAPWRPWPVTSTCMLREPGWR